METGHEIIIKGIVQGVGFRPLVYQLAKKLNLKGSVQNNQQGVVIQVQGDKNKAQQLISQILNNPPPNSIISSVETFPLTNMSFQDFSISHSQETGHATTLILSDLATCQACTAELFDNKNRRYLYPFINCTHCGPRFSIVKDLPYDRKKTSMAGFKMCSLCLSEYQNPLDRRFHAQPNCCPQCGPQVSLLCQKGSLIAEKTLAFEHAATFLKAGKIIAIKGIGGFHLICDATNSDSINRLRQLKKRTRKPLALMCLDLNQAKSLCDINPIEQNYLISAAAPIVLCSKKMDCPLPNNLAPLNPDLGIMLAYSPLHLVLLKQFQGPIVATSGNLSDEPICIEFTEAIDHLSTIADYFLTHNRPIVRPLEDSVVKVIYKRPQFLRLARGYAPFFMKQDQLTPKKTLAMGGDLKSAYALQINSTVLMSQYLGDLSHTKTLELFEDEIQKTLKLYQSPLDNVISDLHPNYVSHQEAFRFKVPTHLVQHHLAHLLSVVAEHELKGKVLGFIFDGTGMGIDNSIWGGEFLQVDLDKRHVFRFGHLLPFRLIGNNRASTEGKLPALGLLHSALKRQFISSSAYAQKLADLNVTVNETRLINSEGLMTSSVGRLFDGLAAIMRVCEKSQFEGDAAMQLEFLSNSNFSNTKYQVDLIKSGHTTLLDPIPMIASVIKDLNANIGVENCSIAFHQWLIEAISLIAQQSTMQQIVLSGGCFQNRILLEGSINRLNQAKLRPFWAQQLPPNDQGLGLGQIMGQEFTFKDLPCV